MKATRKKGRALVVVAIVATAGIAAGAAWYFATRAGGPAKAGPVRELVPAGAAVYVELRGAAALWDSVSASEAAADFAKSRTRHELLAIPAMSDLRGLVDEITTQSKFELNDANLKKLFGREVAVGIVPREGGKAPDWVLVSKLDLAALAKDLLTGDADFSKLHDVIDARTGLCKFTVARTEHRGVAVSRATKGDAAFSFTLVGDALVVARDAALVNQTIDCCLDEGKGSIARVAAFAADVAKVPATAPIVEWYDLDRMRATRASVTAGIDALGGGTTTSAAAVDHVLDGASDIRTIARATELPGGNPYDMKWTWSRGARDDAGGAAAPQHPLAATLLPDAPVYVEVRDVAQLMAAWDRSALARKLGSGYLGKKIDEFMADPESVARRLGGRALTGGMDGLGGFEELDPDAPPEPSEDGDKKPEAGRPAVGAFETKSLLRVARRMTEELAGSSVGFAVAPQADAMRPDSKPTDIVVATRVSDGTRLMLLAAEGAVIAEGAWSVERHGGTPILISPENEIRRAAVAHAGSTMILASSADVARRTIDALKTATPPAATPRTAALDALGGEAHFVAHARIGPIMESIGAGAEVQEMLGSLPADFTMSARIDGDFEAVRFRYRAGHGKNPATFVVPGRPTPACHGVLPADPFMHSMSSLDFVGLWRHLNTLVPDGAAGFADASAAFRDASGVDLTTGLLPAIGPEIAMSLHRSEPAAATRRAQQEPAIPGIILAIEMQQPDIVRKAVDGLLATAQRAIDERAEANGGTSAQIFARDKTGETDIISLSMPEAGMPVTPALAFHGKFLLIVSDEPLIQRCIAAGQPGGATLGGSRALAAATGGLPRGSSVVFLDWNGMLDQFGEYAPFIGQMIPEDPSSENDGGDPLPEPPDFPENTDDEAAIEAWQKEMQAYQEKVAARGAVRVRSWIDAARLVDVIGSTSRTDGGADHADLLIRFAK